MRSRTVPAWAALLVTLGSSSCDRALGIYLGQRDGGQQLTGQDAAADRATGQPAIVSDASLDAATSPPADASDAASDLGTAAEGGRGGTSPADARAPAQDEDRDADLDRDGSNAPDPASSDATSGPAVGGSWDAQTNIDGGHDADAGGDSDGPTGRRDAEGDARSPAGDGGAGDADDGGPAVRVRCAPAWHAENVEARVFNIAANASTACSLPAAERPMMAAAVDDVTFRGAQACGACLRVQGTFAAGAVTVQVVDRSGSNGGILLTRSAMDQISPGGSGVRVDWRLVPCDTRGQALRYRTKEDSNSGYVAVQIRNARYPIAAVAAVGRTASLPLMRQTYNYWTSTTLGLGVFTLRVTDINGQSVQDSDVVIRPSAETAGRSQFPMCDDE